MAGAGPLLIGGAVPLDFGAIQAQARAGSGLPRHDTDTLTLTRKRAVIRVGRRGVRAAVACPAERVAAVEVVEGERVGAEFEQRDDGFALP